ncbi:MAG: hypothetical protein ACK4GD_05040 [Sphingomonadaceae bacterium]
MTGRRALLGWLAVLPALGWMPAAANSSSPQFRPLPVPYRLTRLVKRQLGGDGTLMVERSWSITFAAQGRGFLVEGQQSAVTVDAPSALDYLARIERERVEQAMFPLMLDEAGLLAAAAPGASHDALSAAIAEVRAQLIRHGALESRTSSFLDSLEAAGQKALAQWPRDLFAPGLMDQEEQRTVELPDGQSGTISITRAASTAPGTGLMMHYKRHVRTRIGDDERVGSEAFLLAPKG